MMYILQDLLSLTGRKTDSTTLLAASLGILLPLLAERPNSAPGELQWHVKRLQTAIENDQLRICFDRFGRYCGHAQWTGTSAETENLLIQHGPDSLGAEHLTDKGNAWILDMSAIGGMLPEMLAALHNDWLSEKESVTYFRYKNGRCIAKRLSRTRPVSFLRTTPRTSTPSAQPILTRCDGAGLLHSCAEILDAAIEAGHFFMLMNRVPELAQSPLRVAVYRLRAPLSQHQRRIYHDANGLPAGFLTWAWLDKDALVPKPIYALHPFEWNEGDMLCLMDGVATPAVVDDIRADLASAWCEGEGLSIYARWGSAQPGQFCLYRADEREALAAMLDGIDQPLDIAAMLARKGI